MKFLAELFSDESGRWSSTRVIGAILCLTGCLVAIFGDKTSAATILTSGTALLGVGQVKSAAVLSIAAKKVEEKTEPSADKKVAPND